MCNKRTISAMFAINLPNNRCAFGVQVDNLFYLCGMCNVSACACERMREYRDVMKFSLTIL